MRAVALSAETMRADPPGDSSREQAMLVPLPAAIPSSDETPDRGPAEGLADILVAPIRRQNMFKPAWVHYDDVNQNNTHVSAVALVPASRRPYFDI